MSDMMCKAITRYEQEGITNEFLIGVDCGCRGYNGREMDWRGDNEFTVGDGVCLGQEPSKGRH